jgi:hypothetical protein
MLPIPAFRRRMLGSIVAIGEEVEGRVARKLPW